MKKLLFTLTLVLIAFVSIQHGAKASDAQRDGDVYYKIVTLANGNKEVHIVGYAQTSQHLVIPKKIKSYPVTEIADGAFLTVYSDYWLETDRSPEDNASYQASKLKSFTLPKTLKRIGNSAFEANQLTTITIPNSVVEIGDGAFRSNQLTTIQLSNRLVAVGNAAFSTNELTKVTLPNSVTVNLGNIAADNPIKSAKLPEHLDVKKDKKSGDLYYTFIKNNGKTEIKITGYNVKAKKNKLVVPASINKIPVTEIGHFAFAPHNCYIAKKCDNNRNSCIL